LRAGEAKDAIRRALTDACLAIHPIGKAYGVIPEGESRSLVQVQLEIAAEIAKTSKLPRIIWLPPALESAEPRQQELLAALKAGLETANGLELLQTPLEEVKTYVGDRLTPKPSINPRPWVTHDRLRVYLICEQADGAAADALESQLFQQGYEVTRPVFQGDETAIREEHQQSLLECDVVVIFYGAGSELWLRAKLRDLDKAPGWGRAKPFVSRAIYVASPRNDAKARLQSHELLVLRAAEEFDPAVIAPLLAEIGGSVKGAP